MVYYEKMLMYDLKHNIYLQLKHASTHHERDDAFVIFAGKIYIYTAGKIAHAKTVDRVTDLQGAVLETKRSYKTFLNTMQDKF